MIDTLIEIWNRSIIWQYLSIYEVSIAVVGIAFVWTLYDYRKGRGILSKRDSV